MVKGWGGGAKRWWWRVEGGRGRRSYRCTWWWRVERGGKEELEVVVEG